MIFIWFYMTNKLFALLKMYHPIKYYEMGDPTLFKNNTPKTGAAFLRFLIKKEWKELNDPKIESLSKIMLIFLYVYLIIFITMIALTPFANEST